MKYLILTLCLFLFGCSNSEPKKLYKKGDVVELKLGQKAVINWVYWHPRYTVSYRTILGDNKQDTVWEHEIKGLWTK